MIHPNFPEKSMIFSVFQISLLKNCEKRPWKMRLQGKAWLTCLLTTFKATICSRYAQLTSFEKFSMMRCRHLFGIWQTSCSCTTMTKPVAFSFTTETMKELGESSEKIYTSSISSIVEEFEAQWDSHIFRPPSVRPHRSAEQAPLKTKMCAPLLRLLALLDDKNPWARARTFFAQHQPRVHKSRYEDDARPL